MSAVAHLNVARLRHGWDDPRSAGFTDALDRVNARAEAAPGYLWRLPMDADDEALLATYPGAPDAATLSMWESAEALRRFTYEGVHGGFVRRRAEWFAPLSGPAYVVWPVARDHRPDLAEGLAMLRRLAEEGPSDACFDLHRETAE